MSEKCNPEVGMKVTWAKSEPGDSNSKISFFEKLKKNYGPGPFVIRTANKLGSGWNITLFYPVGNPVMQVWDENTERPVGWQPSIKYFGWEDLEPLTEVA